MSRILAGTRRQRQDGRDSRAGFDLRNPIDVDHVSALTAEVHPSIVVIDAFADIMPGADENSVQDVQPVLQALRRLAERYQLTVIVIHHTSKAGGYRGSTAIKAAVDLLINVESKPDSPNIDFASEKARDSDPFTFAASFRYDNEETEESACLAGTSKRRRAQYSVGELYVLGYLRTHQFNATVSDIVEHADTCSEQTARKAIYRLVERNVLKRSDAGGQGTPARYEIVLGAELPWENT